MLDQALNDRIAVLPPPVLAEILSEPTQDHEAEVFILGLPLLEIRDGYWERVGRLRSSVLARGLKARLADALIAQVCLDHGIALVTRDHDFRHFTGAGLVLLA